MSSTVTFNESASVKLDGSGNGQVKVGPRGYSTVWNPDTVSVGTSTNVKEAVCKIFVGDDTSQRNFTDGTFTGSSGDSTDKITGPIRQNTSIIAVWTGGDAGAIATLTVSGAANIQ